MSVFVNYRRDDTRDMAARIHDRLERAFGGTNVFMDMDILVPGQRFDRRLETVLDETDVFLAVIGPRWLELLALRQASGERDYVREEIAAALRRGIIIIPVLIDRTPLPPADKLPADIEEFVLHHKHTVTHEKFGTDIAGLLEAIRFGLREARAERRRRNLIARAERRRQLAMQRWGAAVASAAVVLGAGVLAYVLGVLPCRIGGAEPRVQELRDCPDVCPVMVEVPAGAFTMGSRVACGVLDGQQECEGPAHTVTIQRPFAVGKFEVTFAEWDACVAAGGCKHRPNDESWGRGRRPVVNVSWDDAKEYVAWLSKKTGRGYRLLSEAEWEYAAGAGATTNFAFGDTISTREAQYSEHVWGSKGRTAEVGRFRANKFGLHDVHGNVWEWVEDAWHPSYSGAPDDGSAWPDGDPAKRCLRGGPGPAGTRAIFA